MGQSPGQIDARVAYHAARRLLPRTQAGQGVCEGGLAHARWAAQDDRVVRRRMGDRRLGENRHQGVFRPRYELLAVAGIEARSATRPCTSSSQRERKEAANQGDPSDDQRPRKGPPSELFEKLKL
jgi:hypothetical protein